MTRSAVCVAVALCLALPGDAQAGNFGSEAGGLKVELSSEPARPTHGSETRYTLVLRDVAGSSVKGARVTLMGRMADGMTVLAPLSETSRSGHYSGRVLFTMEGEWRLTVRITQTGTPLELSFTEQVGR